MIRYDDEHVSVRIRDAGLQRAMNDNALHVAAMRKSENLLIGVAVFAAIAFGAVFGYAAAFGN